MEKTKTLITPYTCQVIFLEMNRFVTKEISPHELILRFDLLNIPSFANISESEATKSEVLTTALLEVVDLDKMLRETPQEMQNYLNKDISGIKVADKILEKNGEPKMSKIIHDGGFSDSPILMYIFLTLTGRYKERANLDRDRLKQEILDKKQDRSLPLIEDALMKVNEDLLEINQIITAQQEVDTSVNLDIINKTIKSIKENLDNRNTQVNIKGLEELKVVEKELYQLSQKTLLNEKINIDVTDKINTSLDKAREIMDYMEISLSNSLSLSEEMKNRQTQVMREFEDTEGTVESKLKALNDNFKDIEETLKDLDLLPVIEDMSEMLKSQELLKVTSSQQVELLGEISSRVTNVVNTITSLQEVIDTLNKLLRKDIILNLSKSENMVKKSLKDTENLGGNYIQWRGDM